MTRRVAIADDEPLARLRLRDLLGAHPGWAIVAECAGGDAAVREIVARAPDLVLLDIRMPRVGGFDVLERVAAAVPADARPLVIVTTAHDAYALRAFEASALDYLRKPISRARFAHALDRAAAQLDLRAAARPREPYVQRLAAQRGGATELVRVEDIDWIDAAGNYARVHACGGTYMLRCTMTWLAERLDPRHFLRVHRSAIVNLDRVRRVTSAARGACVLLTQGGARLRTSRRQGAHLRAQLRAGSD